MIVKSTETKLCCVRGRHERVIEKLQTMQVSENTKLISLDVKYMFSNIPVKRTTEITKNNCLNKVQNKEQLIEILRTFKNLRESELFMFNNKYYNQEDGLPMGSPLCPEMADFYMNSFEKDFRVK